MTQHFQFEEWIKSNVKCEITPEVYQYLDEAYRAGFMHGDARGWEQGSSVGWMNMKNELNRLLDAEDKRCQQQKLENSR